MILMACIAAIGAALALALVLAYLTNRWGSSHSPAQRYFLSGAVYSILLAITPSMLLAARNTMIPGPPPFGLTAWEVFWRSYSFCALLLVAYVLLARRIGFHRWNTPIMLVFTFISSREAIDFVQVHGRVHFDGWMQLSYGTSVIALASMQFVFGLVHAKYSRGLRVRS